MAFQLTAFRPVAYGLSVISQFAAFAVNGFDKTSGLGPGDMTVTVYLDGAVMGAPPAVTITEIGTSGIYKVSFTPSQVGVWVVEVQIASLLLTWTGEFDVRSAALSGQEFYDTVRDEQGNGVPYVLVEVLTAGTGTVLASATTGFDGSYAIPLTGTLSSNPLVDLRFSGNSITTFTKPGLRLA